MHTLPSFEPSFSDRIVPPARRKEVWDLRRANSASKAWERRRPRFVTSSVDRLLSHVNVETAGIRIDSTGFGSEAGAGLPHLEPSTSIPRSPTVSLATGRVDASTHPHRAGSLPALDEIKMSPTVYFASDAHFGAGSRESQAARVSRFANWVATLEDDAILYLVGDVFDYWVDYPTYMPKLHMEVLYALRRAMERGVEVIFVGGNHDIWADRFFRDTLGVPTLESGAVIEHQGVRVRLHHGDGLLSGDLAYKAFRALVRHPVVIFLAKCIHPEVLHRFADWISRNSRMRDRSTPSELLERIEGYARSHDHSDVDHLVIGHIHTPLQRRFEGSAGAWQFNCLGDWIGHFTAGRLHAGNLELVHVRADGSTEPHAASPEVASPYGR